MSFFDNMLLVGFDRANTNDIPVLVIGKKKPGGIDVLNVLTGDEATATYLKLTAKQEVQPKAQVTSFIKKYEKEVDNK